MSMIKIDEGTLQKLQKKYGFKYGKIKGTEVIMIVKTPSPRLEVISFSEFITQLNERKLAVFKSEKGNFLKIMKAK